MMMMCNSRTIIQTVLLGVFLSLCTFAMGQYSDTTYHISIRKHSAIPSTAPIETSKGVTIQNSFPKGGPYFDPSGKNFGYRIFWTRVINNTASPFELTINFPADSFAILPSPDAYLKLFLPPDTMTVSKQWDIDYGATGLKSFLDTDFHKPTMLQRTINPKEECLFYIAALFYPRGGFVRAGLLLKEQNIFYRISMVPELDSALIPCGQIVLKK